MSRKINSETEAVNVEDLYWGCDNVKPRDIDWSNLTYDSWEVIQPYSVEDFEKYGDPYEYSEEAEEKLGYGSFEDMEQSNQPMMNYLYPIGEGDEFDSEDAKAIDSLNVCLVYFTESEEYALALTGGGMDLTWDIVEGYVRLGYLPPVHFSRLPKYAGHKMNPRRRVIVSALLRSIGGNISHLEGEAKALKGLRDKEDGEQI